VTDGMAYCHREKMIHRDLKLENLLLTKKITEDCIELPDVKIVDFGIAGICSDFDIDNVDAGTLKYMAPELLEGRPKVIDR
jgi:serine/threonine protein kinase